MNPCVLFIMIGFVQNEVAGNGQMPGYQWLHLCAVQRGYVTSQDTVRLFSQDSILSLILKFRLHSPNEQ